MSCESLPSFSVQELNEAIGSLLERGFAPRFILKGSVSKSQVKKGHLWLTLIDNNSSITAVAWSSQLKNISYRPEELDGVIIVGRLNFWQARATLAVNIIDIRPSISTVLRKFETVSSLLIKEGIIDDNKKRKLPKYPSHIGLLTSSPSSALADMLTTAKERWPLTRISIIPIPVQGDRKKEINAIMKKLSSSIDSLKLDAIVLARGGGSREDMVIFDDEDLCRIIANFQVPVVTGIGHQDDVTVADLVADYRAATPTAAIVALLPSQVFALEQSLQKRTRMLEYFNWSIKIRRESIVQEIKKLGNLHPLLLIKEKRVLLDQKKTLIKAFSPDRWLQRGFVILRNISGQPIRSSLELKAGDKLNINIKDGEIESTIDKIHYSGRSK